jgi:cytochrome c-type biogenesis protein CcmH
MNAGGTLRRARAGLPGLIALIALAAGLAAVVIVAAGGHPPASQAQQVQQIAAGLHCPICKDLSVADSPAPLAQQMRQEIAQKLRAGQSADQIRAGFVAAYGDSVLMSPPRQGVAGVVYYLPWLVLAAGLITAFTLLRRWLRAPPPGPPQTSPQAGLPEAGPPEAGPPQAGPPRLSAAQRRAVARALARLREEEPG